MTKYLLLLLFPLVVGMGCSEEEEASFDATLELIPSSSFTVVSSSSVVEFTATFNGKDVTNSSDLMIFQKESTGSTMVSGTSFIMSRAGTYTFYAIYGNNQSEMVSVIGITNLPDAAVDSEPTKFDSFERRTLSALATGTWCQYCPYLLDVAYEYLESNDDMILCEAHYGDTMTSTAAGYVLDKFGTGSYPTLYVGLSDKSTLSSNATISSLTSAVAAAVKDAAATAISANTSYDGTTLCVRADVKVAEEGQFRIGVFVLEDDIYSEQYNAFDTWMNTHDNIICGLYPESLSLTQTLGGTSVQEASETYTFYCEFSFSQLYTVVSRENCRVVIFTYNNVDRKVDNAIEVEMGESYPFQYK